MSNFSPKDPEEKDKFTFDFAPRLASGETISSAQFTISIESGYDPNPSAMISGMPTISGSRSFSGFDRWNPRNQLLCKM